MQGVRCYLQGVKTWYNCCSAAHLYIDVIEMHGGFLFAWSGFALFFACTPNLLKQFLGAVQMFEPRPWIVRRELLI